MPTYMYIKTIQPNSPHIYLHAQFLHRLVLKHLRSFLVENLVQCAEKSNIRDGLSMKVHGSTELSVQQGKIFDPLGVRVLSQSFVLGTMYTVCILIHLPARLEAIMHVSLCIVHNNHMHLISHAYDTVHVIL